MGLIKKVRGWYEKKRWEKKNQLGRFKDCCQLAEYYYGPCPKCGLSTVNKLCPHCGWNGIESYTGGDPRDL